MNLFLLDVDGVINAVPIWDPREPRECPWPGGWDEFTAARYHITFAPDLTERLLRIHESGLAEVRWLTTWGQEANVHLAERFGFPHFEVVGEPPRMVLGREWWKLPLAQGVTMDADKTVWADDDLARSRTAQAWADKQANILTLVPDPYTGLTPDDLDKAERFLKDG